MHCLPLRDVGNSRGWNITAAQFVSQTLAARISNGCLGGREPKLDLAERVLAAGPAHQRLDEWRGLRLEPQLPLGFFRAPPCPPAPVRPKDYRQRIAGKCRGRERIALGDPLPPSCLS